jgi:hypothetical protein
VAPKTTQPSDHSSVCTGGKLGCFELSVGPGFAAGTAADGPIVTTLRFAGVGAAAGFCSGLSAGAAAVPGRDRGIGGYDWYEFDRLISPGGRGGPASSKKGSKWLSKCGTRAERDETQHQNRLDLHRIFPDCTFFRIRPLMILLD